MRILVVISIVFYLSSCTSGKLDDFWQEDAKTLTIQGETKVLEKEKYLTYAEFEGKQLELKFKKKKWGYHITIRGGKIEGRKKFRGKPLRTKQELANALENLHQQKQLVAEGNFKQKAIVVNFDFHDRKEVWLLVEAFEDPFFELNGLRNGKVKAATKFKCKNEGRVENKRWLKSSSIEKDIFLPMAVKIYENPIDQSQTLFYDVFDISGKQIQIKHTESHQTKREVVSELFLIEESCYYFKNDVCSLDQKVVIPEGKLLKVRAGQQIVLLNQGELWVKGGAVWEGSEKDSIKVKGEKGSHGIIFVGADVKLGYCEFEGVELNNNGRFTRTGGVTVYRSNLSINHCSWKNSMAEDALNLVGCSSFSLKNIFFENSQGDALDIDFSEGIIENIQITGAMDDGIDLCQSKAYGHQIVISLCRDKGISCGETSIFSATNVELKQNHIALVVKDGSEVNLDQLLESHSTVAIAVFKKKYYYNSVKVVIKRAVFEEKSRFLIEKNHQCRVNGEVVLSFSENVEKELKLLAKNQE